MQEKLTIKIFYSGKTQNINSLSQNTNMFVFVLDQKDKLLNDQAVVYYNNRQSSDEAVVLFSANKTANSYQETVKIDFSKLSPKAKRIRFFISLYDSNSNKLTFSGIEQLKIKFLSTTTKEELAEYVPENDFNHCNFISLAELKREEQWEIEAVGDGYQSDFNEFISNLFADPEETISEEKKSEQEEWSYKILECNRESSPEEIKSKYKNLVKSFHPDLMISLNLHSDIVEFVRNRFIDLKKAYDYLKKLRNFK